MPLASFREGQEVLLWILVLSMWELIMAVGVIMVVPIVLLVLVSQRAIVSGLTRGAIK